MALLLSVVFFFSGAAGVLFETLWFRITGLTLGNSVAASNIVLTSLMAGLAAGNAIAARYGQRVRRPLQLYAAIEAAVGVMGLAIVLLLPPLSPSLGRLFTHLLEHAWLVNLLRLAVAFILMLVPATAMGLTLPLLAKAIDRADTNFGRVLGRLYGWNTLGGMAGALCGELFLIEWLGQRGTAMIAGGLNLVSATAALLLSLRVTDREMPAPRTMDERPRGPVPLSARSWRLLAAAFLAGGTLLALEVFWFRFLQLFVFGTSFIFAAMLAVVLFGIAAGGVVAARWLGRDPQAQRFAPLVALAAGVAVELSYALFDPVVHGVAYTTGDTAAAFSLFVRLMLPTSVLSGALFTLIGAAQRRESGDATEAAGKHTLANTLGGMVGAVIAGFVLLPNLGVEKGLFASMVSYGVVAYLAMIDSGAAERTRYGRNVVLAGLTLFVVAGAFYPFGSMSRHFVPLVLERYKSPDVQLLETREGLTETVMYLRQSYRGQPLYHRLMTNGHSMSATTYRGRRYMKLYAYWAMAVNPDARRALLISYGIGTTAKALTDTRQLESIDVVDISRDILELGPLAFSGAPPPLSDPRVRVHVEDGRFFLQTTDETFDLITAEPPPLRGAGVTTLYSREYFDLVRDRLRPGGVVTYWLPVNQLWPSETRAIMRAFCDAFPDCTLWNGAGLQWMLAGRRGARRAIPEDRLSAQWRDPYVAAELADLGFEEPESLGATFLADAATLADWTQGALPLDDDHPGRILPRYPPDENGDPIYRSWMRPRAAQQRFESSSFIADVWPADLRRRTADFFGPEGLFDDLCVWGAFNRIVALQGLLTLSSLRTLPLLFMDTEPAYQHIAVPLYQGGLRDDGLEFQMGAREMSKRDYPGAALHFAQVTHGPQMIQAKLLRTLALALEGKGDDARDCLKSVRSDTLSSADAYSATWLARFLQSGPGRTRATSSRQPPSVSPQ